MLSLAHTALRSRLHLHTPAAVSSSCSQKYPLSQGTAGEHVSDSAAGHIPSGQHPHGSFTLLVDGQASAVGGQNTLSHNLQNSIGSTGGVCRTKATVVEIKTSIAGGKNIVLNIMYSHSLKRPAALLN